MFILNNFGAGKGYPPSIKLSWFLVCLFSQTWSMLRCLRTWAFIPKLEKVTATFSVKSIMWKCSFWTILGLGKATPIHKAFLIPGLPFFPDVVHVKVFAYMGLHPKTGKKLPQLSQLKVFCKMYLPSIKLSWFLVCLFSPDVVHVNVFAYMGFPSQNWKKVTATFSVKSIMWKCSFWAILGLGKATYPPSIKLSRFLVCLFSQTWSMLRCLRTWASIPKLGKSYRNFLS